MFISSYAEVLGVVKGTIGAGHYYHVHLLAFGYSKYETYK